MLKSTRSTCNNIHSLNFPKCASDSSTAAFPADLKPLQIELFHHFFLISDKIINEAIPEAIKFHHQCSVLLSSWDAVFQSELRCTPAGAPSRLFASAPGAFKPFYPTTQMRDLGFHPWIWAWKHSATCEFEPLNLNWIHILFIFKPESRKRRIPQVQAAAWATTAILSWRALYTKWQDKPDRRSDRFQRSACAHAKTRLPLSTLK